MNRREYLAMFDALPESVRRNLSNLQAEVDRLEVENRGLKAHVRSLQRIVEELEREVAEPEPEPAPEPVVREPSPTGGFPTVPLTTEQIRRLGLSDG